MNPWGGADGDGVETAIRKDPRTAPPRRRTRPRVNWTDSTGPHSVALDARAVFGSAPRVDVVVTDPTVSRLHAEFEPDAGGVWVRDLGSTNGTFVEGLRVTGVLVPDGGRVRLGGTELRIAYETDENASPDLQPWPDERFGPLIGRSVVMRELFARLARVAPLDTTVAITGETGTGKELVAQALHDASPRRDKPFIVVDCAALPEHLLEAELFGYARGAFTGAVNARAGALEVADGGTVFLDEVGELPLALQPKLLRALESRTVRRLGEAEHRKVDVRFVSATHRDLRTMVNSGTFREDLYFRLVVLPVHIPPLRARPEDIPALAAHFLPPAARALLTPELLHELASRPWLGNVRELRNFVDRAVALGAREALALAAPPAAGAAGNAAPNTATELAAALPPVPLDLPFKDIRERWVDHLEREYVRGLLARHEGNVAAVAAASGLTRTYVYRLIRKHEL